MEIDWDRRRQNVRILLAKQNLKPSPAAEAAGLSVNTLTKFTSGKSPAMRESSLMKLGPVLGFDKVEDLDTDNILGDARLAVRKLLEHVPDGDIAKLLDDLRERFPDAAAANSQPTADKRQRTPRG